MRLMLAHQFAVVGIATVLFLRASSAHAQEMFTCRDDAVNTNLVSLTAMPNVAHTSYTGFYQKTGRYLGRDITTFQIYGYSVISPVAYAQYDAGKPTLGGVGAKFNRVELNAVIGPANRMPKSMVTISVSDNGTTSRPIPVKVNGPIADGSYNQIHTYSASHFKPARFLRFGVV